MLPPPTARGVSDCRPAHAGCRPVCRPYDAAVVALVAARVIARVVVRLLFGGDAARPMSADVDRRRLSQG